MKTNNTLFTFLIAALLFAAPAQATGPRVTPSLFTSPADKVYAVDLPPFISGESPGGGLDMVVVNAVFAEAGIGNAITTLPLSKMAYYYLNQEGAVAVLGHALAFDEERTKTLIAVPITAPELRYYFYLPNNPGGGADARAKHSGDLTQASPRGLLKGLVEGRFDIIGLPPESVEWFIERNFAAQKVGIIAMEDPGVSPGILYFNREHAQGAELAERFQRALSAMIEDGRYATLLRGWLEDDAAVNAHIERLRALR